MFDANNKGLVPAYGNISGNNTVVLTNAGWQPFNIVGTNGVAFTSNSTARTISLAIQDLVVGSNITNYATTFVAVYDTLSQSHLRMPIDSFAKKTHGHAISEITNLSTELGKALQKENNLSDIQNSEQAVKNLGVSDIGNTVFYAATANTALTALKLKDGSEDVRVKSLNDWSLGSYRSPLINAAFNIWQRGAAFSTIGKNADGWKTVAGATTGVLNTTRELFTLGQTVVADNPKFYMRLRGESFTSGDFSLQTAYENVALFAGQPVTLSFWTRSSVDRDIRIKLTQNFGTGGTVSAEVDTTILNQKTVNATWQRVVVSFTMPSIVGKIIGSNQNTDYVKFSIILKDGVFGSDIGTSYIDFALFQLEPGSSVTKFEHKPVLYEDLLTKRYYQKLSFGTAYYAPANGTLSATTGTYSVPMRIAPTASRTAVTSNNVLTTSVEPRDEKTFKYSVSSSSDGSVVSESTIEFTSDII